MAYYNYCVRHSGHSRLAFRHLAFRLTVKHCDTVLLSSRLRGRFQSWDVPDCMTVIRNFPFTNLFENFH